MAFLDVKKVSKSFGGLKAINGVSLEVEKGETLGIIGPNGAGKTTLFNVIMGYYTPEAGEILFNGKPIHNLKPHQICKLGITKTFQLVQPFSNLTVLDNVITAALVRTPTMREAKKKAMEILEMFELADRAQTMAKNMTLQEMKRLELTKTLATEPQILMMDECMAGLTPSEANQTMELLHRIKETGVTFILIEHVMEITMSLSDRVIVLNYGTKIAEGTPQEVTSDPKVIEVYFGSSDHAEDS